MDAATVVMAAGEARWIWIHGWGASPDVWRDVIPHVPGKHDPLSFRDCRHIDDCRAQIRRRLAAVETERSGPIVLVGWSMGGMLALETVCDIMANRFERNWGKGSDGAGGSDGHMEDGDFAELGQAEKAADATEGLADSFRNPGERFFQAQTPERDVLPDGLVIISSALKFTRGDGQPEGWPERVLRRMIDRLRQNPDEVLSQFHGRFRLPDGAARAMINEYSVPALASGLEYLIEADLRDKWAELGKTARSAGLELLWIHGAEDDVCPPGAVPSADWHERHMLAGAGHAPFLTHRETFCGILNRFCRKLGGSD